MNSFRRNIMLANSTLSSMGGGQEVPTNLEYSDGPNENNAKIFNYLINLSVDNNHPRLWIEVDPSSNSININNGVVSVYLYEDGTFPTPNYGEFE